jgi:ribosomal protein S15P/S13E
MTLIRVIEEYRKNDDKHIGRYHLNINPETIIKVLDDLVLNKDDYENEIFDPYFLTESQIKKLLPFLEEKDGINLDYDKYIYELMCYEEEPSIKINHFIYSRSIKEFDKQTLEIHGDYELDITPKEIMSVLYDLILDEDDTEDELNEVYELTQSQIQRLKPFLKKDKLNEEMEKYIYYLYHSNTAIIQQ